MRLVLLPFLRLPGLRAPVRRLHTHKMDTKVLRCDSAAISFVDGSDEPSISDSDTLSALSEAADTLRNLQCVAFPTETVYGLGALALDADAAVKIFAAKGRPADNPLIVHVSSERMLASVLPTDYTPSPAYAALARRFWPGPLTLLYPAGPLVPSLITAGQPAVGVRMPAHPVARALIALAGSPLAAPSANVSGRPSPTRAAHVAADMAGRIPLVLDGGPCAVGVESTVVDGLGVDGSVRVLRPGGVTVEDIERVLREELPPGDVPKVLVHRRDYRDEQIEQSPTTPGMKYTHYSPSAPVTLVYAGTTPPAGASVTALSKLVQAIREDTPNIANTRIGILAPSDSVLAARLRSVDADLVQWTTFDLGPIADPAVTAQRLFDGLLSLDGEGVQHIFIEAIGEEREGLAVMNRVRKAASTTCWVTLE
jgi:L-threonylcarbamoyladenylate synthase